MKLEVIKNFKGELILEVRDCVYEGGSNQLRNTL